MRSPCRFSVPPESMMPRSPMPVMTVFIGDGVGERDRRVARVQGLASLPICSSPCSMIHSVVSSRSASFENVSLPSTVRPPQRGRADVEDHVLVAADRDLVAGDWHLAVRPGVGIGPVRRSGLCDRAYAEQECRNDRHAKERTTLIGHDINPQTLKMTQCFEEEHTAIAPGFSTAFSAAQRLLSDVASVFLTNPLCRAYPLDGA